MGIAAGAGGLVACKPMRAIAITDAPALLADRLTVDVVAALDGASSCGLVDFPRHLNVGDSAIWAGERSLLRRVGVDVVASADKFAYAPRALRRQLGDSPLLIHGGGNFGDLYTSHHELRERIFNDFRDRPIIQLPQSMNFQEPAALARTQRIIADHGRITLLVRDQRSFAFATEHFEARVVLTPDAAFGMGAISRPVASSVPVVRQSRTDKELADDTRPAEGTFDWLERPSDPRQARRLKALEIGLLLTSGGRGRAVPGHPRWTLQAYDRFVNWNVDRGASMLARGEAVITDRLHGHIMCVLMGIPHVVLNDRYGKISDFWDSWTHVVPSARLAKDLGEAQTMAASLLDA
jgi:exopolysaccharide biosynthesis predicted pyruvyltransferase EpsI